MNFFDKLKKAKGGYIFLSHSHDDIEKVREIRNRLEQNGFEPLCFYLKCLDDDSEIEDLIKREIDAREWFVFVNSENSRRSKWVTLEREYITSTDSKKIITVDIDNDTAVSDTIEKISHNLRIFVSYSSKDEAVARKISDKLTEKDYLVFFAADRNLSNDAYMDISAEAISRASKEGCVIALLSENSIKSSWVKNELLFTLEEEGNVVPVLLGDVKPDSLFKLLLSNFQQYHLSASPTDSEIEEMIDKIGSFIAAEK